MRSKTIVFRNIITKEAISFVFLTGAAVLAPLLGVQAVTGSVVNATLFLGVLLTGVQGAVFVAIFPSLIALSSGLLPPVLAPMVPFIIMGNVILIFTFDHFKNHFLRAVLVSSFLKFVFLYSSSILVVDLIAKEAIASNAALMMSWPQLLTALLGGLIAGCVSGVLKIRNN